MSKKTKNIWVIGAFIAVFIAFESGIFEASKPAQPVVKPASQPATPAQAAKPVAPKTLYAMNAASNSWPPNSGAQGISSNLLSHNFYVVLDGSGSMEGRECAGGSNKMQAAKAAVQAFVQQISGAANVGLFAFDKNGSKERLPLGQHNAQTLTSAIAGITAGGGTPLSSAVEQGYKALTKTAAKQLGYGEYHLVVVTDGEANSGYDPRPVVQTILQNSPVVIHTIGFCISGSHSLNQSGLTVYKAADDPASLSKGLSEVLAEMPDFNVQSFGG